MADADILRSEMDLLMADIVKAYEASGKKVSGEFPKGLSVTMPNDNTAVLWGYAYLAGRGAGKMPPWGANSQLLEWVKNKGVFGALTASKARGLAYLIARKIAREGTSEEYELKIYQQVITPQRIRQIIDRVAELDVNKFVTDIVTELRLLTTSI